MRLVDLLEDTPTLPTSDLITPEEMQQIAKGWIDHYGDSAKGYYWLNEYINLVNKLHDHGGSIFRIVFLNNPKEFNPHRFSEHWTVDKSQIVDYIDSIRNDVEDAGDAYIISAVIKPQSISVPTSVVSGQPTEWEINPTSQNAIVSQRIEKY